MGALEIQGLTRSLVGPVDLTVPAGACVAIFGPSGAGKTLLLRAIADLDPHGGQVALDGEPCEKVPAPTWRRRVGFLPTESAWWEETVGEHFPPAGSEWFGPLGFEPDVAGWSVHRLSTGERQRLALARLLANEPEALLLDEPTASLNPENVQRVERLIEDYRVRRGVAVLWVSHDPEQMKRVADRRYAMAEGRLLDQERP